MGKKQIREKCAQEPLPCERLLLKYIKENQKPTPTLTNNKISGLFFFSCACFKLQKFLKGKFIGFRCYFRGCFNSTMPVLPSQGHTISLGIFGPIQEYGGTGMLGEDFGDSPDPSGVNILPLILGKMPPVLQAN